MNQSTEKLPSNKWMWLVLATLFAGLFYALNDILFPFVLSLGIAYLLAPSALKLEKWGAPRWLATLAMLLVFFGGVVGFLFLFFPILKAQAMEFADWLPGFLAQAEEQLSPLKQRFDSLVADFSASGSETTQQFGKVAGESLGGALGWIGAIIKKIFTGGAALFTIVSLVFITPVLAFYILRDWGKLVGAVDDLLPRNHAGTIRALLGEIDTTLAAFIRGQLTVCLILGVFYALGLSLAGLQFGLVVGLLAGGLSFIPYLGSIIGLVLSVGLALVQFSDPWSIGIVAIVFGVGQILEGNYLSPVLVGGRVGVHPVWIIFALFAGASLFGFIGALLAVPVASVIGVMCRFAVGRYMNSSLYASPAIREGMGESDPALEGTGLHDV